MVWVNMVSPARDQVSVEMVPDWRNAKMEDMEKALGEINWEEKLEGKKGVECWDIFKNVLNEDTERCIPKKKRRVGTKLVWMNKNTLRLIQKKRRLWKWYTREGGRDYESFQAFKSVQLSYYVVEKKCFLIIISFVGRHN